MKSFQLNTSVAHSGDVSLNFSYLQRREEKGQIGPKTSIFLCVSGGLFKSWLDADIIVGLWN